MSSARVTSVRNVVINVEGGMLDLGVDVEWRAGESKMK